MFAVVALLFGWLYKIGVNRPPLRYAHIPTSTRDFINEVGKKAKDQGLSFQDHGPFDWDENSNVGENSAENWAKEFDENFIVYYHKDNEAQWQLYAQQVLEKANENIATLTDLMGKYYYAADMNGRKLAIYLPETEDLYIKTIGLLMGNSGQNAKGSLGITITQVGPLGCLTKGIVLHPLCFKDEPEGMNGYVKTLQHEMNHYVFFSSLDYGKVIKHYLWVSEGIAEFYCNRYHGHKVSGDSISFIEQNCLLNQEFPLEENSAYWAGESFYRYLESQGGKKSVQKFVSTAYTTTTDSVFIRQKMSAPAVHKKWVASLRANRGQNIPGELGNMKNSATDEILNKENIGKALDITSKVAGATPLGIAAGIASNVIKNN